MPHMGTCILHTPPPCAHRTRHRQQRELENSVGRCKKLMAQRRC